MATLSQLYKKESSGVSSKKSYMVPVGSLYIEDGYNVRDLDQDHIEAISEAYLSGEVLPALTVEVLDDERVKIIDGHHRYNAVLLANANGAEIVRVECKDFVGGEAEKIAYMVTSSQGKQLEPLERADAYKRLINLGWDVKEIAKKVKRSVSDVTTHVNLSECSDNLKKMVSDGSLSYANAVEITREHGIDADKKADELLESAKSEGKQKITKKIIDSVKEKTIDKFGRKEGIQLAEILSRSLAVDIEEENEEENYTLEMTLEDKKSLYRIVQFYLNTSN